MEDLPNVWVWQEAERECSKWQISEKASEVRFSKVRSHPQILSQNPLFAVGDLGAPIDIRSFPVCFVLCFFKAGKRPK